MCCCSAFLPGVASQCFSVTEIPIDRCWQTIEFDGETHSVTDIRHLRRMRIDVDIQGLISSFDDDIGFRRHGDFTALFGLDRQDRFEFAVVGSGIVSVDMRDDGFRKILFDRRTISEIPGEVYDFITGIIEHGSRCVEGDVERISSYGSRSDDDLADDISSIHFDRNDDFCLCAARLVFHDKRRFMVLIVIYSEFKTIRIRRDHLLAV